MKHDRKISGALFRSQNDLRTLDNVIIKMAHLRCYTAYAQHLLSCLRSGVTRHISSTVIFSSSLMTVNTGIKYYLNLGILDSLKKSYNMYILPSNNSKNVRVGNIFLLYFLKTLKTIRMMF